MFSNEVQKLHEHIKEYFRFGKFQDTYECFIAEINAKIVSKKLDEVETDYLSDKSPELIKMMKGVSSNTLSSQKRVQQFEELNERFLDLLAGARQIYGLTVKLLNVSENEKAVGSCNYQDYQGKE